MDPLSEVLDRMKPSSYGFRGLDAGGDWAIDFPAPEGLYCYAIQSGGCWLELAGAAAGAATRLETGDLVLVCGRQPLRLFGTADAPAMDAMALFSTVPVGETAVLNGGGACSGAGGYFEFDSIHAARLLSALPPILHIRAEATRAVMAASIERLMRELREPQPGGALIAAHLAQALLVEALRIHLMSTPQGPSWLAALADPRLRLAIEAMHADPARRWTLGELARVAGMSRSSFAARFSASAGEPAMEYLTRWRMLTAAERLQRDRASIAMIAPEVGYESESAFGAAFKRVMGCSPRAFRAGKWCADQRLPSTFDGDSAP